MNKKWLIAAVAGAAIFVIGVGAVMAQSESGTGSSFLDRVAAKLGIEPDRLEQAITDTRNEDIDAAVARGDLTQEQADRLKERVDEFPGLGGGEFGREFHGRGFHGFKGGFEYGFAFGMPQAAERLAGFLGIPVEQLKAELAADGATLATVAEAHGKSRGDLKAFISDNVNEKLDQAVSDGKLTQERADAIRSGLDERLDKILDFPGLSGEFHGWGFPKLKDGMQFGFAFGLPDAAAALAEFLGIPADQLREELSADAATLATVAEAHGKSRDDLKAFISDNVNEKLAQAVSDGTLTQERAEAIKSRLDEQLDSIIDGEFGFGRMHRFEFRFGGPDNEEGDDPAPAPQSGTGRETFNF